MRIQKDANFGTCHGRGRASGPRRTASFIGVFGLSCIHVRLNINVVHPCQQEAHDSSRVEFCPTKVSNYHAALELLLVRSDFIPSFLTVSTRPSESTLCLTVMCYWCAACTAHACAKSLGDASLAGVGATMVVLGLPFLVLQIHRTVGTFTMAETAAKAIHAAIAATAID
jgi:hypothetical protein